MMLHTKHEGSRPCGFRQEDFFMLLPIKAYVKPVTPKAVHFHVAPYIKHLTPGPGHFWPHGYNLNKLGIGPLDDTSYQISRLKALWFKTRRFFHVALFLSLRKTCDPRGGAIFCPRAII